MNSYPSAKLVINNLKISFNSFFIQTYFKRPKKLNNSRKIHAITFKLIFK